MIDTHARKPNGPCRHRATVVALAIAMFVWVGCASDGRVGVDAPGDGGSLADASAESCTNTADDPNHCGACGVACEPGAFCVDGRCADSCPDDYRVCGDRCVHPPTNNDHCGSCGNACAAGTGCADGSCVPLVPIDHDGVDCSANPPVQIPDVGRCAGDMAETTFRWALCSCNSIELRDPLWTDAFDSQHGPYDPEAGELGGGVGSNGFFASLDSFDIGGALWSASSADGISTDGDSFVRQDLSCRGDLFGRNPLVIDGDARVAGDIETTSSITIGQTLYQPEDGARSEDVSYGALAIEPVDVVDPCPCEPGDRIPVADIVAAAATDNDNAALGLDPDALVSPGGELRLDLPCGRYFLSGIESDEAIVVAVHGRTAIFIEGDLLYGGTRLEFLVYPGAELDLFVSGRVAVRGQFNFGSRARPAASRLYVGGPGEALTLQDDTVLNGFVYAPEGELASSHPVTVHGGLFVGEFSSLGDTRIHYDRAILSAGDACAPPDADECTDTCTDCGSRQACVEGSCGECTGDGDCCAPMRCHEGSCTIFIE
jgi:hypothetical protein